MEENVANFISQLALQYPLLTTILVFLGTMRVINKPLLSLARAFVKSTATQSDDVMLLYIETSKFYKAVTYFLDWTVSIKLPPKTIVIPKPEPEIIVVAVEKP